MRLTIAYSCYKEGAYVVENLKKLQEVKKSLPFEIEVIVIDDNSPDDSSEVLKKYRLRSGLDFKIHKNERNFGFAKNFVIGAMLGKGDFYRYSAGDDATSITHLIKLYSFTGKADLVIPYNIQKEMDGKPQYRKLLSNFFTKIVNFISGYNLKYYNGLPTFRRDDVLLWHPTTTGFGWQAEMIITLLDQGYSYLQVYTKNAEIKNEFTSMSVLNYFSVAFTLIRLLAQRIKKSFFVKSRHAQEVMCD